jgi:hypothetical protein
VRTTTAFQNWNRWQRVFLLSIASPRRYFGFVMSRTSRYLERFEFFCQECKRKGTIPDVLLNGEVLLIRGYCPLCKNRGAYKEIDIRALRREHELLALEEANHPVEEENGKIDAPLEKVKEVAHFKWKWKLVRTYN